MLLFLYGKSQFPKFKEYKVKTKKTFLETDDTVSIAVVSIRKKGNKKAIVIAHGFTSGKNEVQQVRLAEEFAGGDWDVISFDFRGHGESGGTCTFGQEETRDLKAVLDYANEKYEKVGLIGFSMGAATSIIEVSEHKNADAVIAVSPYADLKPDSKIGGNSKLVQSLFGRLLIRLMTGVRVAAESAGKRMMPIGSVQDLSPIPLLLIHGDKDPIVHIKHSERLFEKAGQPKKLLILRGGKHAEEFMEQNFKAVSELMLDWMNSETG
jgi:alpha-beta hydrolase superfamily lysophospholipase